MGRSWVKCRRDGVNLRGKTNWSTVLARCFGLAVLSVTIVCPVKVMAKHRLESISPLAGSVSGWDYLAFDQKRQRLFISRRTAGASVFDVRTQKVIADIDQTAGANAFSIVPELNLGFVANQDGTATKFDLETLKTITRFKFGEDCDTVIYDPATKQLIFTMSDSEAIAFADPIAGATIGKLAMGPSKLESVAVDGLGNLFVVDQRENRILRVDLRKRAISATWKIGNCDQATGMAIDSAHRRLLIGCRGASPVLAVMNADNGAVVNTYPIGRGNDGVIYDAETRRVYFTNGVDANFVAYDQIDADTYKLAEVITSLPYAKTIAFDRTTKKIYSITARGRYDPTKPTRTDIAPFYPNEFFPGTLAVLTFVPY